MSTAERTIDIQSVQDLTEKFDPLEPRLKDIQMVDLVQ